MDPSGKCIKLGISSFVDARLITEFKAENSLKAIENLQESLNFGCLESAFNHTKAFLKSAIDRKKLSSLSAYREILSKDETNLNALHELNKFGGGKTEKQARNRNCKEKMQTCFKKEAAISTACLEIGFALQYLNEEVHTVPLLQKPILNPDELKFKTDDDITVHCKTTSMKGVKRTSEDGFLDTCIEAVIYLREGLQRQVTLKEDNQAHEGAQAQENAQTQEDSKAQEDAETQENTQAQENAEENVQAQGDFEEDTQVQNDGQVDAHAQENAEEDAQAQEHSEEDAKAQENSEEDAKAKEKAEEDAHAQADAEEVAQVQEDAQAQEEAKDDAQLIWKFFLAKAYNRLVDKVCFISVSKEELRKWGLEAIKLFCEVINGNESVLKAKSYAYLGQMISTRKKILGEHVPESFNSYTHMKKIWETPAAAFDKARSNSEKDDTVLVRYGNFLSQDIDGIDEAIEILTEAIEQNEFSWFPHYCRMIAYKKKYSKQNVEAERNNDYSVLDCSLLEKAKRDGKFCLKVNPTTQIMVEYSRILHWLSEVPKEYKGRAPKEIDVNGIRKAIDVLDKPTVMESGVATAYKERANCHHLIGEFEEAILYMEAAVYSNRILGGFGIGLPVVFRQLCAYSMEYVETKLNSTDEEKNVCFAIRRLKTVVTSLLMWYRKLLKNEDARLLDRDDQRPKESFTETEKETLGKQTVEETMTEKAVNKESRELLKEPLGDKEKVTEPLPKEDEEIVITDDEIENLKEPLKVIHGHSTIGQETAEQLKQPLGDRENIKGHLPKEEEAETINEKKATDEEIETLKKYLTAIHENECKLLKNDKDMTDKLFIDGLLATYNPKCLMDELDRHIESLKYDKPILCKMICKNKKSVAHKMVLTALNTVKDRIDAFVKNQKFSQDPTSLTLNLSIIEDFVSPESLSASFSGNDAPFNQAEKQYDFMVLHADEDKEWVACCLLIQLEHSKVGFKGFLPERDFKHGKRVLYNIAEGINKSNKILLAVSPDTPTRFYEDLKNVEVLGCLNLFNRDQKDTYVLNNGSERIPDPLHCFDVIDCSGLPFNLNEVRKVLADTPSAKCHQRPLVSIQSTGSKEVKIGTPENIMTAKCEVNDAQNVEALRLLRFGIQAPPIYCSVRNLEQAEEVLAFGYPQSDMYLCYESCVLCYDTNRKISKWVAYHLTPDSIKGPADRKKITFHEDERIPEHLRAKLADFNSTLDYGRGHQRPAADTKYSMAAMYDSFTLTNILPERKNNKMWAAVEVYVRNKVLKDFKDVRIYSGPIFRAQDSSQTTSYRNIGPGNVAVPTHMFKIVIATVEPNKAVSTATFIVENTAKYGYKQIWPEKKQKAKEDNGTKEDERGLEKKDKGTEEVKQEEDERELEKKDKGTDEKGFLNLVEEMTKENDIKSIEAETGIQFDKMLRDSSVKFTEDLLTHCPFISAAQYKDYESEHIQKKKQKETK